MKKILVFLLWGMLFHADVSNADDKISLLYTLSLFDKNSGWPGMRVDSKPHATNELTLTYKGFVVGTWISLPLKEKLNSNFNSEVDLFLAYKVSQKYFDLWIDAQLFMLYDLARMNDDQGALSVRVDLKHMPLNPFFGFREYLEVGKNSPERGIFWYAGLTRTQPVLGSRVNVEAAIRGSDGPMGADSGISSVRLSIVAPVTLKNLLPFPFLKEAEILPSFVWVVSTDKNSDSLAPRDDVRFRSEERRVGKECRSRWSPYH